MSVLIARARLAMFMEYRKPKTERNKFDWNSNIEINYFSYFLIILLVATKHVEGKFGNILE